MFSDDGEPLAACFTLVCVLAFCTAVEFEMMTEQEGMWNGRSFFHITLGCTTTSVKHAAKGSPSSLNTQ